MKGSIAVKKKIKLNQQDRLRFGRRLSYCCHQRNITQKDLAKQLTIHPSYITHFINGRSQPSDELLAKMAIILGTTEDYLLFGSRSTSYQRTIAVGPPSQKELALKADSYIASCSTEELLYMFYTASPTIDYLRMTKPGGMTAEDLAHLIRHK